MAERVDCPHAAECPGCALIALPYAQQLAHKRERVRQALARYPELAGASVAPVAEAEPRAGYRTRAKLVVGEGGALGLYAAGSHRVIDIPECRILAPVVARTVSALRQIIAGGVAGLAAVDVRELAGEPERRALVTWIGALKPDVQQHLVQQASALAEVAGVAVAQRDPRAVRVLGAAPEPVTGDALFADRLSDHAPYALVTHGSFVQTHRGQAARIVNRIQEALAPLPGRRVIELYGGSGFVALSLAEGGAHVTLVESFAPAARACERAAGRQGLGDRLRVHAGDAAETLRVLLDDAPSQRGFDAAIVNPPRRGLVPQARAGLARVRPDQLVYVSCDPETLARDLAALGQLGLRLRSLEPLDMIAQSADVEVLALLEPGVPPALPVLHEDAEILVLLKPPHLATTPHPERLDSVLERAIAQHGLAPEQAAAVHRLDLGTSGVCLIAKRREAVAPWAEALAKGEKVYLALARGLTHKKGKLSRPLQEQRRRLSATTRYVRLRVAGGHSWLEVRPEEGRTHQIRRHLASVGHPVLGDVRYGHEPSNRHFENAHGLDRTFLHLSRIELRHPRSGSLLRLEAPLAGDLEAVLASLADQRA